MCAVKTEDCSAYIYLNFSISGDHNFNSNEGHEVDSRVSKIIVHPNYARLNNDVGRFF